MPPMPMHHINPFAFSLRGPVPKEFITDFQSPSDNRQYEITVDDDQKFYVDMSFLSIKSPYFDRISRSHPDGYSFKDISRDEFRILLESVCPTLYNIYPKALSLPSRRIKALAAMAERFQMHMLTASIEKFCLSLHPDDAYPLLGLFDVAFFAPLSINVQVHFLKQILLTKIGEFATCDDLLNGRLGSIVAIAWAKQHAGKLDHQRSFQEFEGTAYCSDCPDDHKESNPSRLHRCAGCSRPLCKRHIKRLCDSEMGNFIKQLHLKDFVKVDVASTDKTDKNPVKV